MPTTDLPDRPAAATQAGPPSRRLAWMLALPRLGMGLIVLAVAALLWLLHTRDQEEQHNALISDVLWLEQNIGFQFANTQTQLEQLALDLGERDLARPLFQERGQQLIRTIPELIRLGLIDGNQRPLAGLPGPGDIPFHPEMRDLLEQARALGHPAYARPVRGPEGALQRLVLPIYARGRPPAYLLAEIDLGVLLREQVPWWFAEKYQVRLVDDAGQEYAAKSKVARTAGLAYRLPLDPPGYGFGLEIHAYRSAENSVPRLLAVAIVALMLLVLWSLGAIRKQVRQRLDAEAALRRAHAFREAMENSLPVGMRARDLEGRMIYVNPAFCRMTGFSAEELLGRRPPMPYWDPESLDETAAAHARVLAGQAPPDGFEIDFRRKDGSRLRALIHEAPLIDEHGRQLGWMGSVLDVTEKRRAEELARQQQEKLQFTSRLVTLGELASTLAHELNQPLAAIASYAAGCSNRLADGDFQPAEMQAALDKLGQQARRAGAIIRRVLDFVRKSAPRLENCRIETVIEDSLALIEPDMRQRGIVIDVRPHAALPPVRADRVLIEQVLINLLRNAGEAMADTPAGARRITLACRARPGEIEIRVADQGAGISPDSASRLFEAFYTTKPDGMGIGLSICRSIVEFHHGRLWFEPNRTSSTGQGTVFAFTLPKDPHANDRPRPSGG